MPGYIVTQHGLAFFCGTCATSSTTGGLDYALVGKLADRGHPRYAALLAATTTVSIVLLVFGKLLVAFTHKPGPSRKSGYKLAWFCLFELSVFAMEDCTTIFIFTQVDIYDAESFVDRANIWTSCTSGGLTIVALFAAVFLYTASGLGELAKTDAAEQQDKRIHCGETLLAMFCCGAADVDGGGQGVHRGVMASGFVGKLAATIGEWCQTHGAFYSLITYLPLGPPTAMLVFFLYLAGVVYLREEFAPLDPKSLDSSAIAIYIIFLIFAVGGTLFIFFWVFVDWGGPNGIVFTLREKLASKLFRNPEWYEDAVKRWSDDRASRTAEGVEHGGKWYIHIYTPSLRGLSAGRAGASLATLSRQAENWKMVIFEDKGGGKVKVKDDSGKYLVAKDETAVRWAFHPAEEDWATFTFTPVRGSQFTLQSCHDKYLACVPSSTEDKAGGNVIAANSNGPWAQETFTRIPWRKSHGSPHLMTADPLTEKLLGQ